ncbi:MAG TPA: amino acid ABC transporter substrate-binding protein, partial [Usitatibacter sp.]|nr:amino acid ABC transporter substrate-binding protein [Usitatibacter sp.]
MRRVSFTAIAAAFVLLAAAAQAQTMADIKKRGTMRLGYSETSAPFSFKAKDGAPAGYSIEICQRIATAVTTAGAPGAKVEWVPLTPGTRLESVATGAVDIECGTTTITLSRREKVDFSIPIFVDAATLLVRKSTATSITQLQGKKVAAARATTTIPALERALARGFVKVEVVRTGTVMEGFELLRDGKVDALAGDRTALVGTFLQGGGAEGLMVLNDDLSYEPYALVLRKDDSEFRLLVDRVIAQLYRGGEIEDIYGRWLAPLGKPS